MRVKFLISLWMLTSILLASCSGQKAQPVSMSVNMTEYAYSPDTIEAKVGQQVTLELTNSGVLSHELMIGKQVRMEDSRPSGYKVDLFESAGVEPEVSGGSMDMGEHGHGAIGVMVTLPKTGDKATMTFTVTDDMVGEWEIGCFSQEGVHYDAGMKGKLTVTQ